MCPRCSFPQTITTSIEPLTWWRIILFWTPFTSRDFHAEVEGHVSWVLIVGRLLLSVFLVWAHLRRLLSLLFTTAFRRDNHVIKWFQGVLDWVLNWLRNHFVIFHYVIMTRIGCLVAAFFARGKNDISLVYWQSNTSKYYDGPNDKDKKLLNIAKGTTDPGVDYFDQ